jgi:hypothetical protein
MKLSPEQQNTFGNLARQFPEFGEFLSAWRQKELEQLPYAAAANLDVTRGRVQSLTELQKAIYGHRDTP